MRARRRDWNEKNHERLSLKAKERNLAEGIYKKRYANNIEKHRERERQYRAANRERHHARVSDYEKRRRLADLVFCLTKRIRSRIAVALKQVKEGRQKADRTIAVLGCSFNELKEYICSKFVKGMTWRGVLTGRIQLDHIIPCSKFDLTQPTHHRLCFHFTNLQPLWRQNNQSKGAKIIQDHQFPLLFR